ncbi:MAG: AGE family epimerase/isomerase [Prevotella sp.]|jgi:mannobiose 2-epimerase|nr:AGE family epimerase/isomerase [Prevotella sp.]
MKEEVKTLKAEVRDVLENNILNFWLDKMVDEENGGFYGQMTGEGEIVKTADKGGILNARILWSFSAAYRVLHKQEYLEAATRAKDYIIDHFIDKEYGGTYWSLDYKGQPKDTKKQFYAIGFTIYGLSEYARATGDREALDYAMELYECIEEHSLDREYNGYIEACTREWGEIADMRLSELDANYPKSQNTHLHIIEPYTNLFRCIKELKAAESCDYVPAIGSVLPIGVTVPDDFVVRLESSLRNLITIFTDKILNPDTHHLDLFFDMDWTREAGRLESYGHDIECSWLMHEAALVLGDETVLRKVETVVQMVAKASEKGLNEDGSMVHEANLDTGYVDTDRHWWVQAENVVGWINIWQYFGDESALQKALRGWQYIKDNLIDREGGEWWWSRDPERNINRKDDKAGFWKCPYHNSRMCLELMERDF